MQRSNPYRKLSLHIPLSLINFSFLLSCLPYNNGGSLAAISVASSVISFFDFATKLVSTAKGKHHSATGSFGPDKNLRYVTNDLRQIAGGLVASSDSRLANLRHSQLEDLAQQCEDLADEILGELDGLMKKSDSRREAASKALKRVWKAKDLKELEQRLLLLQQALDRHMQQKFHASLQRALQDIERTRASQKADLSGLVDEVNSLQHSISCVTAVLTVTLFRTRHA